MTRPFSSAGCGVIVLNLWQASASGGEPEPKRRKVCPLSKMRRDELVAALREEGFTGETDLWVVPELRDKLKNLRAEQARLRVNFADALEG